MAWQGISHIICLFDLLNMNWKDLSLNYYTNASSTNIDNWKELGLNSKVFIVLNLIKIAIIGGTEYGGEIKIIFSALNFIFHLKA